MRFTVLGASGFIGSHQLTHLNRLGHDCYAPTRNDPLVFSKDLGHVFYCIGLTADFRQRPFDTVQAHICHLAEILQKTRFESLLYLSSSRIYGNGHSSDEDVTLQANPQNFNDFYNLTKMTGEALCFSVGLPNVRVVRLSNVYGEDFSSGNFLSSIIRDALIKKSVVVQTTLESSKEYVSVNDVVKVLTDIALSGRYRVYNVASGMNVTNRALLEKLSGISECTFSATKDAPTIQMPPINIQRVQSEFGFAPSSILADLEALVLQYRQASNHDKN